MAKAPAPAAKSGGIMSKKIGGVPLPILALGGVVVAALIYKKIKGSSSSTAAAATTPASTDTSGTDTGSDTGSSGSGSGGGGWSGGGSQGGGLSATLAAIQASLAALAAGQTITPNTTINLAGIKGVKAPNPIVPVSQKPTSQARTLPVKPVVTPPVKTGGSVKKPVTKASPAPTYATQLRS